MILIVFHAFLTLHLEYVFRYFIFHVSHFVIFHILCVNTCRLKNLVILSNKSQNIKNNTISYSKKRLQLHCLCTIGAAIKLISTVWMLITSTFQTTCLYCYGKQVHLEDEHFHQLTFFFCCLIFHPTIFEKSIYKKQMCQVMRGPSEGNVQCSCFTRMKLKNRITQTVILRC